MLSAELPFQEGSLFKKFEIKFRNQESVEDVKKVLCNLEKDAFLNEELEGEIQTLAFLWINPTRSTSSRILS